MLPGGPLGSSGGGGGASTGAARVASGPTITSAMLGALANGVKSIQYTIGALPNPAAVLYCGVLTDASSTAKFFDGGVGQITISIGTAAAPTALAAAQRIDAGGPDLHEPMAAGAYGGVGTGYCSGATFVAEISSAADLNTFDSSVASVTPRIYYLAP